MVIGTDFFIGSPNCCDSFHLVVGDVLWGPLPRHSPLFSPEEDARGRVHAQYVLVCATNTKFVPYRHLGGVFDSVCVPGAQSLACGFELDRVRKKQGGFISIPDGGERNGVGGRVVENTLENVFLRSTLPRFEREGDQCEALLRDEARFGMHTEAARSTLFSKAEHQGRIRLVPQNGRLVDLAADDSGTERDRRERERGGRKELRGATTKCVSVHNRAESDGRSERVLIDEAERTVLLVEAVALQVLRIVKALFARSEGHLELDTLPRSDGLRLGEDDEDSAGSILLGLVPHAGNPSFAVVSHCHCLVVTHARVRAFSKVDLLFHDGGDRAGLRVLCEQGLIGVGTVAIGNILGFRNGHDGSGCILTGGSLCCRSVKFVGPFFKPLAHFLEAVGAYLFHIL